MFLLPVMAPILILQRPNLLFLTDFPGSSYEKTSYLPSKYYSFLEVFAQHFQGF